MAGSGAGGFDISRLWVRWLVLAAVVILPFWRFLLRNSYPAWSAEAAAATLVLAIICLTMAALARQRFVFLLLAAACSALMAVVPAMRIAVPWVELTPRMAAAGLLLVLGTCALLIRERFAMILTVFTVSVFAADLAMALAGPSAASNATPPAHPAALPHVLYIVVDEHIGPAGLPAEFAECRSARSAVETVYARHRFRLYSHAFSNYPSTVSSLASVLNRHVLERRRTYLNENSSEWRWGTRTFQQNRLLEHFAAQGYRIEVVQHRAINHVPPRFAKARVHEYWDQLGQLAASEGDWYIRFRWLVGNYQQSDLVVSQFRAFFPFRFAPHTTGPLSMGKLWPEGVASLLEEATSPTFVFVHLMKPHFPFLYRKDSTVRPLREWSSDRMDQRVSQDVWQDRYRRYCEQVESVTHDIDGLLSRLSAEGLLDAASVIIHGDHGSRIRMALPGAPVSSMAAAGSDPERFDYPGAPPLRDLLDRFSTLAAFKPPRAQSAVTEPRKASLLTILNENVPLGGSARESTEFAYLFDGQNRPVRLDLLEHWTD